MLDFLTETFLTEYFKFCSIAVKFVDAKTVFDKLYEIFLLPEQYRDKLYATTQCDVVKEVQTQNDYMRYLRIDKYTELESLDRLCARSQSEMLKIKGNAIQEASLINLAPTADITGVANYKLIADGANAGKLSALRVLGFLQCEGMALEQNVQVGVKNILKSAQWNNVEGLLMALYYDEASRKLNINRLYTLTEGTPFEQVLRRAEVKYGVKANTALAENKLLAKAFGVGTLKSEIYSAKYARFLFSNILRVKDKEQLLFTPNNEVLSETADLPLKLSMSDMLCDVGLKKFPLRRETEKKKITQYAQNADLRNTPHFRPLCVCAESKFMRNLYAEAITKMFDGSHVERIDVADLAPYDFEPSKNNIFVRICNEDANNVYLMNFCGDLNEQAYEAAKYFLQSDKRCAIRLNRPSVVLDMSAVLPVCFCDRANAKRLKEFCDVVNVAQVTAAEKGKLLAYILESKQKQYGPRISVDEKAVEQLSSYSIDKIEDIIDQIARARRQSGDITVTSTLIKEVTNASQEKSVYGFGGHIYED